jgi:hypothetical protein
MLTPDEIKVFVRVCKKLGIKLPTMLLIPGLPRVEGKKCIYSDGTVRPLSEALRLHAKTAAKNLPKSRRGGGKL